MTLRKHLKVQRAERGVTSSPAGTAPASSCASKSRTRTPAPPCNAGRSYSGNFSFIGLLPAPNEGISPVIRLYLNKLKELKKLKRYRRVTLAGSRVFIRAVQQANGWENKRYLFASSAVIPAS